MEVTGIFYVASKPKKDPFTRNTLLIRQSSCVVASDVRTVSNVSLSLVPHSYNEMGDHVSTADQHTVVVEADEGTH